jgi:hypothetical protein
LGVGPIVNHKRNGWCVLQFGVCTGIENAEIARSAGFAFIEPTVRSLHSGKDFAVIQAAHAAAGLPTPTFNVFMPGELKITGPSVDMGKVQEYVAESMRRVQAVGGELVVFGSGGARNIPDGFSRDAAWQQLIDFLRMAADECDKSGVTIAIEPLNRKESNVINSVAEGVGAGEGRGSGGHSRTGRSLPHGRGRGADRYSGGPRGLADPHPRGRQRAAGPRHGQLPLRRIFRLFEDYWL